MRQKYKRMGQEMVREGLISPKQLKFALEEQRRSKGPKKELIGEILVRCGFIDEKTLVGFLEKFLGVEYAHLKREGDIDPVAVGLISEKIARTFKVIPLRLNKEERKLIVAMSNPFDVIAIDTLKFKTKYDIEPRFALSNEIESTLAKLYEEEALKKSIHDFIDLKADEKEKELPSSKQLELEAIKTPVIQFVDHLLKNAVKERASDIHIEPGENELRIRYRIDGILQDVTPPPKEMQSAIITRVKLIGGMDIAEHRLPQDGRYKFKISNVPIDVRMASTPITYGEKLVLRILDSSSLLVNMEDLGIEPEHLRIFKNTLSQPYGMILVTGPTGSGKTTTLYSALGHINTADKNIVTIEDPVEYQLQGINQIQAKHQIGLTFAAGLRTVLRQDPDVIMIGEIRDLETLENAVKASLTGHLVLSTLHTNNAPSTIMRLTHMGLEPYLISSCLTLVIAQRLARKICASCREEIKIPAAALEGMEKRAGQKFDAIKFYQGKGCEKCGDSGYKGRVGLYEFLPVTKNMKQLILEGATDHKIRDLAYQENFINMFQAGMRKVNDGVTTIDEVLRVTVLEKIE